MTATGLSNAPDTGFEDITIGAPDGLRLHVRSYGPVVSPNRPMVCLPGLARTAADFHELALALSTDAKAPRRVVSVDYRGRGRSDYDRNPDNYALPVELDDVLAVIGALGLAPAVFVGTSRGGLLVMLMAAVRPAAIAGAVLNDIGPVIEPKGLIRIKGYVGKLPRPRSFEEGAEILRRLFDAQFPRLDEAAWLKAAHRTWEERRGRLMPTYDVHLAKNLEGFDPSTPLPALWKEFDALRDKPLMVVRGANSDLLSEATVAKMAARHPRMDRLTVPDQGHTPLLAEPDTIARIASFAAACDRHTAG